MCPYKSTKTGAPAFDLRFDFRHLMSESDVGTRGSYSWVAMQPPPPTTASYSSIFKHATKQQHQISSNIRTLFQLESGLLKAYNSLKENPGHSSHHTAHNSHLGPGNICCMISLNRRGVAMIFHSMIISCFLEVQDPIVQLPLEDKLHYRWTPSREQAVDLW
ncbi:hypothetical protein D5086_023266 [Populus alba]|uniref:Uncharacterized protein n=1 Tax=Populus alba TaxID=43335 RepID=A0ACC4B997_POPAL